MQLLLIRHAEPTRIGEGEADGPADPPLSPRGQRQAAALAAWLADERIDHVVSSPMRRAVETATPLLRRGQQLEVEDDLAEFDRDADHYIPIEELRATKDPRFAQMAAGDLSAYGEGDPAAFADRVAGAVERVIGAHPGGSVAVVCHGGVINAWTSRIAGVPRMLWFEIGYTGICRITASRAGHRTIASLNELGHLRGVG